MRKMLVLSIETNAITSTQSGKRDGYGMSGFRISGVGTEGATSYQATWCRMSCRRCRAAISSSGCGSKVA